ncbi:RrF2 family transcriptional regulator [Actibacterium ureilyticum]|uniref:RrF2 family transcriptional regulator n=1 Tax=Actibacterium ureilyticum TaxID=1590614 RepID=UPI000BAADC4D|nr:Rrf2 family transcriptional regulator [Actibacterium ureilyticum]
MKMSDGVEAAIHCVTLLASIPQDAVLSGADLARFHGVSASYLLKHLKALVAADVLVSVSGPKGGYRLARAADRITLLDIVLAVEGGAPAFRCREIRRAGPNPPDATAFPDPCGISVAMLRAERAYRDALARTPISELVREHMDHAADCVLARGAAFLKENLRQQG